MPSESPTLIRPGPGETFIPVPNPGPGAPYSGAGAPYSGACARRGRGSRLFPRFLSALADYEFRPETGLAVGHSRLLFGDAKGAAAIADQNRPSESPAAKTGPDRPGR